MGETGIKGLDGARDGTLVQAARSGSHAAFSELIERHKDFVYALALAITGSLAQSEEVVQETFIVVWKRLAEVQRPERFRGWVCGIARVVSLNLRRDEHRRLLRLVPMPSGAQSEIASSEPSPLERAISREQQRFVWGALAALPEIYSVPLVLFYREDQSIESVAEVLDLDWHVAQKRISRGRRLLQQRVLAMMESAIAGMKAPERIRNAVLAAIILAGAGTADAAPAARRSGPRLQAWLAAGAVAVAALGVALGPRRHQTRSHEEPTIASRLQPPHPPPGLTSDFEDRRSSGTAVSAAPWDVIAADEIMSFDFEDGTLPAIFVQGHPVAGPPRPGSLYSLVGTVNPRWGHRTMVMLGPASGKTPIFAYSKDVAVSFDYWHGRDEPENRGVWVEVYDNDKKCNFDDVTLDVPAQETWAHAEVRLVDFKPANGCPPSMEEGDAIRSVSIFGGRTGGPQLYVDNIRIFASASHIRR